MFRPDIKPSAVVRHPKFGMGKVLARFGEDELSKVIIKFQEEGEKKLSLKYDIMEVDLPEEEKDPAAAEAQS